MSERPRTLGNYQLPEGTIFAAFFSHVLFVVGWFPQHENETLVSRRLTIWRQRHHWL